MNGSTKAVGVKATFDLLLQVGAICAREDSDQGQLPFERLLVQGTIYLTYPAEPFEA